jgi:Cof subfamily protein (haloacid dehalogenase superfamily)
MDLLARFPQKPKFLVGIDLDGTLLRSDMEISEINSRALRDAQASGIAVSLISGRSHCGFLHYLDDLGILAPCAGDAGAIIFDPIGDEVLQKIVMSADQMRCILDQVQGGDVLTYLHDLDSVIFNRESEIMSSFAVFTPGCSYRLEPNLIQDFNQEATKVAFIGSAEVLDPLVKRILSVEPTLELARTSSHSIEINAAGANKGVALQKIAAMLEIPPENTFGIGDSANDFELIRQAGVGVAVANAVDALKEMADLIAPSNEDEGVAWVLTRLMQKGSLL